jgi:hypothetical protein
MNAQEARSILAVHRPSEAEASDPRVAEALELARRDPELGRWLAEQRAFDEAIRAAVRSTPAPAALRAAILAGYQPQPAPAWRKWPVVSHLAGWLRTPFETAWSVRLAAAGALLLAAALIGWWASGLGSSFNRFRDDLVHASWDPSRHLHFVTTDLEAAKRWLAQANGGTDFVVPAGLQHTKLFGCSLLHAQGRRVACLCFADGRRRHLHLLISDAPRQADAPAPDQPQFEQCGPWKTVAWSRDGKTYILVGMDFPTFVEKFRRPGRWSFEGPAS